MNRRMVSNLPYLLLILPFAKLAQGFRLAPGMQMPQKLVYIRYGVSLAFQHPGGLMLLDVLFGVIAVLLLRMAVWIHAQEAKKYRRGVEYGSARWGTPKDIAPFMDKEFFQNIPLTKTERLTMSSRPKDPKYARNKNVVVIGGSGSGKTRSYVKPSLLQMHSSYVVTDPNGYTISR